jgi:hypothetical protein
VIRPRPAAAAPEGRMIRPGPGTAAEAENKNTRPGPAAAGGGAAVRNSAWAMASESQLLQHR